MTDMNYAIKLVKPARAKDGDSILSSICMFRENQVMHVVATDGSLLIEYKYPDTGIDTAPTCLFFGEESNNRSQGYPKYRELFDIKANVAVRMQADTLKVALKAVIKDDAHLKEQIESSKQEISGLSERRTRLREQVKRVQDKLKTAKLNKDRKLTGQLYGEKSARQYKVKVLTEEIVTLRNKIAGIRQAGTVVEIDLDGYVVSTYKGQESNTVAMHVSKPAGMPGKVHFNAALLLKAIKDHQGLLEMTTEGPHKAVIITSSVAGLHSLVMPLRLAK